MWSRTDFWPLKTFLLDGTFCASRYLYDNLTRAKVGTAPVNRRSTDFRASQIIYS